MKKKKQKKGIDYVVGIHDINTDYLLILLIINYF